MRAGENLVEARPHCTFTRRITTPFHIGRVLKQGQYALFAVLRKSMQIEQAIVGRRWIDLEVAGVNQHPQRGMNRQRHAVHKAVRHLDGVDGERPDFERFACLNFVQFGVVEQTVLFQFAFNVGERELGTIHGNIELGQDPRQCANVILVPVRQNQSADVFTVFGEIRDVRHHDIDAQQLRFGKHQARIDHDNVVGPANGHTIHAELAESAQWDNQ